MRGIKKAIKIKYKLDKGAFKPEKAHEIDAGFDLRTPKKMYVFSGGNISIDTGVHLEIPEGYCGLLVSKSDLNVKHNLVSTGLIDSGYTDSIIARIDNLGDKTYVFEVGDKITQIVILPISKAELEELEELFLVANNEL